MNQNDHKKLSPLRSTRILVFIVLGAEFGGGDLSALQSKKGYCEKIDKFPRTFLGQIFR